MISIALVVFREVFEIALIIGVLMAATKGLAKRVWWVGAGMLLGVIGAALIAFFADVISQAVQGMGQEMLNAAILLIAAALIGWTTIWMTSHGRQLTREIRDLGQEVIEGRKPLYTLAIVVALSVLREGAEIVMFTYSVFVSGEKVFHLVMGGLMGIGAGVGVGMSLYYGLTKVPARKIFNVTGWFLVLLVAGMVAQAFGYLTAAGKVPEIIPAVWDTSKILSEGSFLGKIMHVLVGYTARPSGIQLLVYFVTLAGLSIALKTHIGPIPRQVKNCVKLIVIGFICLLALSRPAYADKHVYSPLVVKGEWELEARGLYDLDHRQDKNAVQEYKDAIGYGVTDHWATELYVEYERQVEADETGNIGLSRLKFTHMEWENRYQLTEQGQYWVDAGLYFAYEVPLSKKEEGKIEGKILVEKSFQDITHTANIILERKVGGGAQAETEGDFAWSSRYRLSEYFQPGLEYWIDFGELNKYRPFNEQSHQLGPVFYGKVGHVKYDVGYLFGASDTAPKGELKLTAEYEFRL